MINVSHEKFIKLLTPEILDELVALSQENKPKNEACSEYEWQAYMVGSLVISLFDEISEEEIQDNYHDDESDLNRQLFDAEEARGLNAA